MTEPAYQVLSFRPDQAAKARQYKKRKTHRKSKAGCFGCKLKRVKCDENRPSCGRCSRSKVQCSYVSEDEYSPATDSPVSEGHCSSVVARIYAQPSTIAVFESAYSTSSPAYGVPRLTLLNHLHQHFNAIQGLQTVGGDLEPVIKLGKTHPYLLDASLAIAASHLRYKQEQHLDRQSARTQELISSCRVAEYFQQSLAIRSFQQALQLPLDQSSSDALLITCMMLNLLTFSMVQGGQPEQCWVFSNDPGRLNWFSINMGLKTLLLRTTEYKDNSILQDIFRASDDEEGTYHGREPKPLVNVPEHWMRLCGLSKESLVDDVFYEPVRILAIVRHVPVSRESMWLYMNFFGKLDFEFRDLLDAQDERAIWLLGYWLGMLCRFVDTWWFRGRSLNDFRGICLWLEQQRVRNRPDEEGEMWNALMDDLERAPVAPSTSTSIDWEKLNL